MSEMTFDETLEHFGVKGMKWGVRKSESATGISRKRGAVIDRNVTQKQMLTNARSGVQYRRAAALGKKILGEKQWESNYQTSISRLNSQNRRLRAGKLTVSDKLDVAMNTIVDPASLVIARSKVKS